MSRRWVHPGKTIPPETSRPAEQLVWFDEATEITMEQWELLTERMENMQAQRAQAFGNVSIEQARLFVGRRVVDTGNNSAVVKSVSIRNGVICFVTELNTVPISDVNWEATDRLHSSEDKQHG